LGKEGLMTKKKVILVDDVELLIELERTFLRREEVQLFTARDGAEALEIIRRERPDLVFLDAQMPVMDGCECCRKVKDDEELRSIPVVMLTASVAEEDLEKCRASGCDDILVKPINRHFFVEAASTYLFLAGRAAPRVEAQLSILFGPEGKSKIRKFTVNLSSGGVFIETEEVQPVDTLLELKLTLAGEGKEISCKGRVAWLNSVDSKLSPELPVGMGVEFQGLELEDLEEIFSFVKKEFVSPTWKESLEQRRRMISELHRKPDHKEES
jgi:uncharacterized protein (TIGR02266 family)